MALSDKSKVKSRKFKVRSLKLVNLLTFDFQLSTKH